MFGKDEKTIRNELRHECELPQEENIVVRYITTGCCVNLRRLIRHQFLMSDSNHRSRIFFKSTYVIRRELRRHLTYHYFTIHPFSNFRSYWEIIMTLVMLQLFALIPARTIWQYTWIKYDRITIDIICFTDIILNFFTGFQSKSTNRIILKSSIIVRNYACSWFLVDLIPCINYDLLTFFGVNAPEWLIYLSYIKFFRIITLLKYLENLRDNNILSMYKVKTLKLVLFVVILIGWCTSLMYISNKDRTLYKGWKTDDVKKDCLYKVVYMLMLFGSTETVGTLPNILLEIMFLSFGILIQLMIIAQILQVITKSISTGNKYYQLTQQVEEFMRYKNLPLELRERILTYFDFRFQQNYYKEGEILKMLSPQLRQDLLVHTYMHLLEKVAIFDDLPVSILSNIIYQMKPEIFMPSEIIVNAGTVGDSMFFIGSGTVAVYTAAGKEICHLSDGANFGELSLIIENEHRLATVVAIDCCEIFVLHRRDFLRPIERFPEIQYRIRNLAQDKVRKTIISFLGDEDGSQMFSVSNRSSQIEDTYFRI